MVEGEDSLMELYIANSVYFYCISAIAASLIVVSLFAAHRHSDTVGFSLTPLLALALSYDNAAIASAELCHYGTSTSCSSGVEVAITGALRLRGAVHAFVIPLFLVILFELNYTVHKKRSSNFFLIKFDQGRRRSTSLLSFILRNSIWGLALSILLAQIVLNSPYIADPLYGSPPTRFLHKGFSSFLGEVHKAKNENQEFILGWESGADVIPWFIFLTFSLYTGLSLWRYGTTISTDVRTSSLNPWAAIMVASSGLTVAWFITPVEWTVPYATNALEVALAAGIVVSIKLVDINLRTLEAWERGLNAANSLSAAARWIKSRHDTQMMQVAHKRPASITLMKAIEDKTSARTTGSDEEEDFSSRRREGGLVAVVEPAVVETKVTVTEGKVGIAGNSLRQSDDAVRRGSSVKRFE